MNPIPLPIAELKSALTGLSKIINRHATLPALQMIHIERNKDGWLCLTGTDLDRFVTVRFEQPSQGEPLVVLAHYDELQRLTKACAKNETLLLSPGSPNHTLVKFSVANGTGEAKINSVPTGEFPEIPKVRGKAVPLPDNMRTSLHEAMACASTDESRYVLHGAFIDTTKPDAHYIVATDGRHLYSSNSFNLAMNVPLNIPKHKFLGWRDFNLDGEWQLKVGEPLNKDESPLVQINSRRWRFITKQIGGNYPNWKQVVPDAKHTRCILQLDPGKLDQVLQIIDSLPCHDDKFRTIGLSWRNNRLCLKAKEQILGEWLARPVPLLKGEGPDMTVFCNRTLLTKALQFGLSAIHLIDDISPLRFTSGGKQMIVMPIRAQAANPSERPSTTPPPRRESPAPLPPPSAPRTPYHPIPTPPQSPRLQPEPSPTEDPFEEALQQINAVKETLRSSLGTINSLTNTVKQMRADRRSTTRDLQSFRNTLRTLQKVPL
ncbi:DNA polymerase III subunit beta [Phragmitibacter flavus]|uniref:Beta sliding clamp n=1 Tax=Phragmitibacter flavus TaxID=2576071 RepID=A0A5R8KH71_9BACT|nr:DNA polymerase III subunit beta [Phragmitibacter flavus]TLD71664.1 DNA polymerase III subunit beta [Phragmitibacter flavus]